MMVGDRICKPEVRRKKTLPRLEMETLPLQRHLFSILTEQLFFFFKELSAEITTATDGQEWGECFSLARHRM